MANSSAVPAPIPDELQRSKAEAKAAKAALEKFKVASVSTANPRKLVRPSLPARTLEPRNPESRRFFRRGSYLAGPLRGSADAAGSFDRSSHAETFYLQKQLQSQTLMMFVLEDGEQLAGYIEWYDKNVVKVRHGSRTLIYKSSIKYLYKAEEGNQI